MKKIKWLVFILSCVLCCAFGFAACDEDKKGGEGGVGSTQQPSDEVENGGEDASSDENSVVGKTYVFKSVTGTAPGDFIEITRTQNEGGSIFFSADGEAVSDTPVAKIRTYYSYVQDGSTVTLTVVKFVVDGNETDNGTASVTVMQISAGKLYSDMQMVGEGGQPINMHVEYELKAE